MPGIATPLDEFRVTFTDGSAAISSINQILAYRKEQRLARVDPLPDLGPPPGDDTPTNPGNETELFTTGGEQDLQISYYLYYHLGNTRIVFHTVLDCKGEVEYVAEYVADYYPFGKILREWVACDQERYLTTYHERDIESGYDYRGARFYDSDLGRFLSVDPLARIYPVWSPYHYVKDNPLLFVDPTGKEIRIVVSGYRTDENGNHILDENGEKIAATGYVVYSAGMDLTDNSFVNAAIISLNGILNAGADNIGIISRLSNDPNVTIYVREIRWTERNGSAGGSVSWSSEGGLVHSDGIGRHGPALSLLHELGHAYYQQYDPEGRAKDEPDPTSLTYLEDLDRYEQKQKEETGIFDNYEDKWIIDNVENPAADILGFSKRNSHTHKTKYKAINPFSTIGPTKNDE
ncbi:RHS repeat-associated core domain-containing protein [Lewinella sp. LCG006]|uniref:RHS repeat-associated core domain-containing protein n=1 Tax=Lewinella sp. LCG006 TaxID=3231911 RepID=UPI00345F761B